MNSHDDNLELFVTRVKVRIDKLLDGRKKSNDKHLDLLKYIGYLSNIDVTLELINKTKILDTLEFLQRIDSNIQHVVSELYGSWQRTLGQNLTSKLMEHSVSLEKFKLSTSFNDQLSESINTIPNQQKKNSANLGYSNPMSSKLNSLAEIEPLTVDLNNDCLFPLPRLKQIPSLPDILLPENSVEDVNRLMSIQRRSVKRVRCPSNSISQFISRNTKRKKLYAGKIVVCSLHELCIRKIVSNVQLLCKLSCFNFKYIEPILDRICPRELIRIELMNPQILSLTDGIWKRICQRAFRDVIKINKGESWREKYNLMQNQKEEKLKVVSCKISSNQSNKKPSNMAKTISLVKTPKRRKFLNPNKNDRVNFNNDIEFKKRAPLMKRTIMEFRERKQISKSKPVKFF